jgi:alpha-tubulin suppressor-like RCC1 family protein
MGYRVAHLDFPKRHFRRQVFSIAIGVGLAIAWQARILAGIVVEWGDDGVPVPAGSADYLGDAAGNGFTLAIRTDGSVTNWGSAYSAPGAGNVPPGLSNAIAVCSGYSHSMALRADGTVFAWGDNTYGETNVPQGLSNVVQIAAGRVHSMALKNDGTVVAWGGNQVPWGTWPATSSYAGQATVPDGLSNVVVNSSGRLSQPGTSD